MKIRCTNPTTVQIGWDGHVINFKDGEATVPSELGTKMAAEFDTIEVVSSSKGRGRKTQEE